MRIVTKEPEAHLVELLNLVDENRSGWIAVCFGFSRLLEHYRSEYQIKIATNLMNDLLGDRDGAIYLCEDTTLYVMVRNFPKQLLEKMIFQLRYLFMDDPLSYTQEGDENPEFATIYDLENQFQDFLSICKRRLVLHMRGAREAAGVMPKKAPKAAMANSPSMEIKAPPGTSFASMRFNDDFSDLPQPKMSGIKPEAPAAMPTPADPTSFNAGNLAKIESDLREVDLTSAIRRQSICAAIPGGAIRAVFDEMYIHIRQLRNNLGTKVDLTSNRWLFKYLTQMLDVRMLDTIQRNPLRYLVNPISVNLNIATLLSTRFLEFDAAIKSSTKTALVIELQLADVFMDMAAFLAAKDTAQKLGYRVCLDGVNETGFTQIDRARLGFDLIKLIWNADTQSEVGTDKNQRLSDAIRSCGVNRVILTRCDNMKAIEFGQALGITLFQGRQLDATLNPGSRLIN